MIVWNGTKSYAIVCLKRSILSFITMTFVLFYIRFYFIAAAAAATADGGFVVIAAVISYDIAAVVDVLYEIIVVIFPVDEFRRKPIGL